MSYITIYDGIYLHLQKKQSCKIKKNMQKAFVKTSLRLFLGFFYFKPWT